MEIQSTVRGLHATIKGSSSPLMLLSYLLSLFTYLSSASIKHYLRNGKCRRKSRVPYKSLVSPFSFRVSVFLKTVCKQLQGQFVLTWAPKLNYQQWPGSCLAPFPQENGHICSMEIKFSYCLTVLHLVLPFILGTSLNSSCGHFLLWKIAL